MKEHLAGFKDLIKERCGLVLEGYAEDKLAEALAQRIADSASGGAAAYYARLCGDVGEFHELVKLLTVNETYFFREPEQLSLLAERLAPRLLERRGDGRPLCILSAGCSSGEEPYSIVMALHETYGDAAAHLFSFAGCDIDGQILDKARSGRYSEFSFRGVPAEIKARYFERERWEYVFKERLRSLVQFHELNLLSDSYPAALRNCDVIFFRNVSIYFDTPTRRIIQQNLAASLADDGYLVLGSAETLANDLGVFKLVEEDGQFYFAKHPHPKPAAAPHRRTRLAPPPDAAPAPRRAPAAAKAARPGIPPPPAGIEEAQRLLADKRTGEALAALDRLIARNPGDAAACLLKAHILLNRKDFAGAEANARHALETEPWSIDAFVLLGLAAKWQEQREQAVKWFRQAVYAHHECWPAHFYLADIYRTAGESEKAQRAYRGVLQLLSPPTPDTGIKVVPLGLPVAEVRFLCEHRIEKLGGRTRAAGRT